MKSLKELLFAVFLASLVFSIQNTNGKLCTKKNYYCPNNTLNYNISNPVEFRAAQRQIARDILSSRTLFPQLSTEGKKLIADVLSRIDTDSPSALFVYYLFSYWCVIFLANPYEYPSPCYLASFVNSSVSWRTDRDGNAIATSLRLFSTSTYPFCTMIRVTSLQRLGCDRIPEYPTLYSKCYRQGRVYEVEENLQLFGSYLPCSIQTSVLNLYSSKKYSDNVMAAVFSYCLSPQLHELTLMHSNNALLETFYLVLNNNISVCCCPKRYERFNQLCFYHNATVTENVETIVRNEYLLDECATEAENVHS